MRVSGPATDKLAFTAIYVVVALVVVGGARSVANYAMDAALYRDYLMPWEVRLMALRHTRTDRMERGALSPVAYMQVLVSLMRSAGIEPPHSNTEHEFVYLLSKYGQRPRRIMLVCADSKLIIYGLPATTFNRLDRLIDGQSDALGGRFTGQWSTDQFTRIGYWQL